MYRIFNILNILNEKLPLSHNVFDSPDRDLQLFIDLDMSILGEEAERYKSYAVEIRNEYIHVISSEYCEKRSKFLRNTLKSEHLSATSEFRAFDARAKENIEWEINELENSRVPGGI
jgi:predicted metal-dependent HD superfamily phosphohydrolase